ncbi:MAG: hypothetical protein J6C02_01005 [Peptococcaceae bacterium]|nr:hypothetical protein [Peptococcaceae bacterium]MBO5114707.1 hypothetical protein [Peptococcaceae bacterium]MBO5301982.1 hypothetical protein [Peptococcaceae bacterium]MBO5366860.1 hypothetical protein [Peptococcaceae bacterium]
MQKQNEKRLDVLKKRVQRCVCKSCGGPLSLRQLDYNEFEDARIELFCEHCDKLEFGIEPELYTSAQYYVDEYRVNFYPDMGNNQMTRRMSISYVADIMNWAMQHMGYLTKEGFTVAPDMEGKILQECIVLNDQMADDLEKELMP